MRILVVGDLHGKDCWREIEVGDYDKVIFLGDYVDGDTHSDEEVYENLQNVRILKEQYKDKVLLLLGNHDIQYLHYPVYRCSGFRMSMADKLSRFFNNYIHLFQLAYQVNNFLFTHAGLSNAWYRQFKACVESHPVNYKLQHFNTLADALNSLEETDYRDILHQISVYRGGMADHGGVTWADKQELLQDALTGYHQVVGHTPVPYVERIDSDTDTSVTFIDVLRTETRFYELDL